MVQGIQSFGPVFFHQTFAVYNEYPDLSVFDAGRMLYQQIVAVMQSAASVSSLRLRYT